MPPKNTGYYAIKKGKDVSNIIVRTWDECSYFVTGTPGSVFKKFLTEADAKNYLYGTTVEPQARATVTPVQQVHLPSRYDYVMYTDGSFSRGKGGFAVVNASTNEVLYGPVENATSQRAELTGILLAKQWAYEDGKTLIVKTDSQYSVKIFNEYLNSWIGRYGENPSRWRTATGEPVKNTDLITAIIEIPGQLNISHVRGHAGDHFNTLADEYANKGRESDERVMTSL